MEILIIGVIIVGLMVYASTKIKKDAQAAFEEETIDTPEFSLVKPEGFLNPVENPDSLKFYAYSREYGEADNAEKMRQSLIELKIAEGQSLKKTAAEIKKSFALVISEINNIDGAIRLKGSLNEKEIEKISRHLLIAKNGRIYDLEISYLSDYEEKFAEKAEQLLTSFCVK